MPHLGMVAPTRLIRVPQAIQSLRRHAPRHPDPVTGGPIPLTATTTPPDDQQVTWQFPSNEGGAEYGFVDAAAAHFRADPMAHLVREMIQNAMDANEDGLDEPVQVTFSVTQIPTSLIGSDSLHLVRHDWLSIPQGVCWVHCARRVVVEVSDGG